MLAICGLLMGRSGVQSANMGPQLWPFPTSRAPLSAGMPVGGPSAPLRPAEAAQRDAAAEEGVEQSQAQVLEGETQLVNPSITLTASKDIVDRVNKSMPPVQANIPMKIDIVKDPSAELGPSPGVLSDPNRIITTKQGNKTNRTIIDTHASTLEPVFTFDRERASKAPRIDTSMLSVIVTVASAMMALRQALAS